MSECFRWRARLRGSEEEESVRRLGPGPHVFSISCYCKLTFANLSELFAINGTPETKYNCVFLNRFKISKVTTKGSYSIFDTYTFGSDLFVIYVIHRNLIFWYTYHTKASLLPVGIFRVCMKIV